MLLRRPTRFNSPYAVNIFVDAVDDPPNASVYLGGVVRRAGVTFAISTDGRAPALAGLLREALDSMLPTHDLEQWMAEAGQLRQHWRKDAVPMQNRRPELLESLIRLYKTPENKAAANH